MGDALQPDPLHPHPTSCEDYLALACMSRRVGREEAGVIILKVMAQVVFAILDGVSRIWDWTAVYEGPPTYSFKYGGTRIVFDDRTAAAIHHDWVMVGGDMRRAMEKSSRSTVGQK